MHLVCLEQRGKRGQDAVRSRRKREKPSRAGDHFALGELVEPFDVSPSGLRR
jgi:hypothetical protein